MNILRRQFKDYISEYDRVILHPRINQIIEDFPENSNELSHIILYGPSGTGKYTKALKIIQKYSPNNLLTEHKLIIEYDKNVFIFKTSDIHYEIDLEIIGCNSKLIWNEFFKQIEDILLLHKSSCIFILCKNFHKIHRELLQIFYTYMQMYNTEQYKKKIKFILLTEDFSFIPNNIEQCCILINIPIPPKSAYSSILNCKTLPKKQSFNISNIYCLECDISSKIKSYTEVCDTIIQTLISTDNHISFMDLRELCYKLYIMQYNIEECIWYIITELINLDYIKYDNIPQLQSHLQNFFKYYSQNFRPIFHIEQLLLTIKVKGT